MLMLTDIVRKLQIAKSLDSKMALAYKSVTPQGLNSVSFLSTFCVSHTPFVDVELLQEESW